MVDVGYIKHLIEAELSGTDQFLVDIKLSPGKLAVFIDKPSGVTIDECSKLCRYLINELEPGGFLERHEVEVSSPGMDQPLKVYNQYLKRVGGNIKVVMADGKLHKGKLVAADNNGFELFEIMEAKENKKKIKSEKSVKLNYNEIKETKIEFNFK